MNIGKIISTLRKIKQMTQEQLADAVGVSAPAVSKWETGSTYPDITLLAPLARALDTTIDNLLSYKQELSEEDVDKIKKEIREYCESNGFRKGMGKCLEYLKMYPNSDHLKMELAMMTTTLAYTLDTDYTDEEYFAVRNEREKIYEQVAKCGDINLSMTAKGSLAACYMQSGKFDQAEELLNSFPKNEINADSFLPVFYFCKGDEEKAAKLSQKALAHGIQNVFMSVRLLYETAKKRQEKEEAFFFAQANYKIGKIVKALAQEVSGAELMVDVYIFMGNRQDALLWFERYIEEIIDMRHDYQDNLFFDRLSEHTMELSNQTKIIKRSFLKSILINPAYEAIKDSEEYKQEVQRLKDHIEML